MPRSGTRSRRSGSYGSTIDDLLETSISQPVEETAKTRSDYSPSSHERIRNGIQIRSRSQNSSRSRRSLSSSRSRGRSCSRSSSPSGSHSDSQNRTHAHNLLQSRRENRRYKTHNNSGTPNQTKHVDPEQNILEQSGIEIDLKSLSLKAEEELSNRPKNGVIYDEVEANLRSIKKRLKKLSKNHKTFSIDEAIEISDAAYILKLLRKSEHEIELAGKMAHSGALFMLQADMIAEKGRQLLAQSKQKLRKALS